MVRPLALLIVAGVAAMGQASRGQETALPTPQALYEEAFALEHVLRGDLDAGDTSPTLAKRLQSIITAYETVVRRYPRSGYCDNALWQAAGLAREAAEHWNQDRDRRAERRYLQWLITQYPGSPFVARARERLARAEAPQAPPPKAATPPPRVQPAPGALRAVRRTVLPDVVRVTIELDGDVPHTTDRLDRPPRVLFDFSPSRLSPDVTEGAQIFSDDVVPQIRIGARPRQTTRVVIDLTGVKRYSAYELYNPYRLVVDCERAVPGRAAEPAGAGPPPAASKPTGDLPSAVASAARPSTPPPPLMAASWGPMYVPLPVSPAASVPPRDATNAPAATPPAAVSDAVAPAAPPLTPTPATVRAGPAPGKPPEAAPPSSPAAEQPVPPPANLGGGYSLARQLGLGVSRVVIDPGHGGHDPGAQSPGTSEAAIALDVALRLEKLLVQTGSDVVLTRRTDSYVGLEERTAIANRAQADLFLSIHVNANRNRSVRGVETYFLNFASTPDAASVAARENASASMNMGSLPDVVKAIALSSKVNESRDFASMVQQAMVRRLGAADGNVKNLGVKQAPFVVLIGAAMPSVLVEISFITNGQDARLLRDTAYRQRVAAALADAVQRYQKTLKADRPTQPQ